jgi:hypothetical protein
VPPPLSNVAEIWPGMSPSTAIKFMIHLSPYNYTRC